MSIDMSSEAIGYRLRRVEQLRRLARSLARATLFEPGPLEENSQQQSSTTNATTENDSKDQTPSPSP